MKGSSDFADDNPHNIPYEMQPKNKSYISGGAGGTLGMAGASSIE